jgi:hypothetical protein
MFFMDGNINELEKKKSRIKHVGKNYMGREAT